MYHYAKSYVSSMTEMTENEIYFTVDRIPRKAIKEQIDENDDAFERWHSNCGTPR